MERLDMIAVPIVANYGPINFLSRAILKTECQIKSNRVKFLNKKANILIRWDFIGGSVYLLCCRLLDQITSSWLD